MPFGTAQGQLRKLVLFNLVQRLNEDVCFRCSGRIETARELSVEHKLPWLDVDPALFWDLGNVAFSHLGCNAGAARRVVRESPVGQKWCSKCEQFKAWEAFAPSAKVRRNRYCRACETARQAKYRGPVV